MKHPDGEYLEDLTWEEKAKRNPLYAVMSYKGFAESGPEPTEEELERFFADGKVKVEKWFAPWLTETATTPDMRILEYGCGMGRLIKNLADVHPASQIYGVDVSPTMVSHAGDLVPKSHFDALEGGSIPHPSNHFHRVYSYAVFQHISRRSVVVQALNEIGRVLAPGGRVKLQFEMTAPPPFIQKGKRTYALEGRSIIYGWTKKAGIPLAGARILRSNNWQGIRLGYSQIIEACSRAGIQIYGIRCEHPNLRFVWFYGAKSDSV